MIKSQGVEIFLIKESTQIFDDFPDHLKIAVLTSHRAYYKLISDEKILTGGMYQKGLNIIDIKSSDMFQNPGTYTYALYTKKDDAINKKRFSITVRIMDPIEAAKKNSDHSDNMKILIPSPGKTSHQPTGPLNPLTHRYENLDSINLFGIISTLIKKKKLKKLQEKLNQIRTGPVRCRQMTVVFYPDHKKKQNQPVYASVTLYQED